MKLEPHRIGGERSARQSRPLDRAFALLDPLLARPALVVEGNDALGRATHVRHDEADAGIKFSGMPLDLGDNPPRLSPGSGLIAVGGSMSDDCNNLVANQTTWTLWFFADSDPEEIRRERHAAVDALMGIKPGMNSKGMIAAQLIAFHNASMECYRRAMIRDQTFEGRREALSQANNSPMTRSSLRLTRSRRHYGEHVTHIPSTGIFQRPEASAALTHRR